jgi:DNA-binding transcriptional ArsR family regulator
MESSLLDRHFAALADGTRRGILAHLEAGDATVSQLAHLFGMTLTGIRKHVAVLEAATLVTTRKKGRTRYVTSNSLGFPQLRDFLDAHASPVPPPEAPHAPYIDLDNIDVT